MKKFFDYIQLPNFDVAADAAATFKVDFGIQCHALFKTNLNDISCHFVAGTLDKT